MDRDKVTAAVNHLITEQHYAKRAHQIVDLVESWEDSPRVFAGDLAVLNVLVDLGVANRPALDAMFHLAEARRKNLPIARRVDYQRELMRAKRERLAFAVEIDEIKRGKPYTTEVREKLKRDTQKHWMAERNAYLKAIGPMTWKETNEATQRFWAQLDAKLRKELANLKKEKHK